MKLGIIGLPSSGKTTVFNALTKGDAPTGQSMGGRFDVLTAVVDVYDERVDVLTRMFNPKKTTFAKITYTDVAGIKKGANEGGGLSGELLNHLSGLDGFVHVVRAFESDLVPHPDGRVDAARDLEALDTEFLLNDLGVVERRMEKIEDGLRKGASKDKAAAQAELALFQQLNETLSDERPLRTLDLSDEQEKMLRGYGLRLDPPRRAGEAALPLRGPDDGPTRVRVIAGELSAGFSSPGDRLLVLSEADLFGKITRKAQPRRRRAGLGSLAQLASSPQFFVETLLGIAALVTYVTLSGGAH